MVDPDAARDKKELIGDQKLSDDDEFYGDEDDDLL